MAGSPNPEMSMATVTRCRTVPGIPVIPLPTDGPAFLLESPAVPVLPGSPPLAGRWSFGGSAPCALLTGKRRGESFTMTLTTWRTPDGQDHDPPLTRTWRNDPFTALRELQGAYAVAPLPDADAPPFCGGLVGYFGYETAHAVERLPGRVPDVLGVPDVAFMVVDDLAARDRQTGTTWLIATGRGATAAAAEHDAELRLDALEQEVLSCPGRLDGSGARRAEEPGSRAGRSHGGRRPASPERQDLLPHGVQAQFSRREYCAAVERCREAILAGRVFEVCLTQQMALDFDGDPRELYRVLKTINPAPYAAFLHLQDFAVAGASPERFLKLDRDGWAESRPIKGTAPRGTGPQEDARLREGLAASAKDRAENVMIVDLVRNDLGRVCETGSISVPQLCAVESYATVHQLVSTVRGRLEPGHDAFDLVRACFPGGSMTGAPKVEAMKLIDETERSTRGVYSGALGYLDRRGGMDLAIVIRTLVCRDGKAWLGTGGAVTADSEPAAEYEETLAKARALITAVRETRTVRDDRQPGRPACS